MSASAILASATHPSELFALVKYITTPPPNVEPTTLVPIPSPEDPTYTRAMCYHFLNLTSRSFARVIQELDEELRHPICLFYLILRGLDTVEDDMTIDVRRKKEVLEKFHDLIYIKGWNFNENGKDEKDRELLVRFDVVIAEFLKLKERYQVVIADITKRMGEGMSRYASASVKTSTTIHHIEVETKADYDLYTHYVAGLVGIGLTELFVASDLERPELGSKANLELANEMGQFLQKVNITKDFLEDLEEGRVFWPKEVWSKYTGKGQPVEALAKPENLDKALACLNELVVDALRHVPACLDYMGQIQNESAFRFCAIPQMMAIATLDHFFNSPALFTSTGTKIRRGLAVKLMTESGSIESVKRTYESYAQSISRKNAARVGTRGGAGDDSFLGVSLACGKIVQWIHTHDKKHGKAVISKRTKVFGVDALVFVGIVIIGLALALGMLPAVY
ncbi:isoprenoid synthase domain-containing protein [Phlyctochytrium arcticum]|nr:isoprenoid synthase domain-containing protein [Phlyctochytrium arcticum]